MYLTYLRRELRRRSKQTIVVAVGLAIGIGLVMTVSSASSGVKQAQSDVLHSLYGVGTDITVTKAATPGSGGPLHFGGFGASGGTATRPAAGTQISRNTLHVTPGSATLTEDDVTHVASLHGVAAATGGLTLTDTAFSGTIPSSAAGGGFAGASGTSGAGPSFSISSFTVDGVQPSSSGVGPLAPSQISSGSYFSAADTRAHVAVVSTSYAAQQGLKVGSSLDVAGTSLQVIGLAKTSSGAADAYIPLGTAQALADLPGKATTIYVSATSASSVSSVAAEVQAAVPGATVSTSASLAKEVSGSITSASNLANSLGRWLAIAALIVAFLIAGLLMLAAVARRVPELGTLKAIGWRTRRVVGQVMGEGIALGVIGGVLGILLGIAGIEIVDAVAPSLTATVGSSAVTGGGAGGGFGGGGFAAGGRRFAGPGGAPGFAHSALDAAHTVLVPLSAPLQGSTIALAVVLAVAGGLVAGMFGSWRAARLRPAAALRRVE